MHLSLVSRSPASQPSAYPIPPRVQAEIEAQNSLAVVHVAAVALGADPDVALAEA